MDPLDLIVDTVFQNEIMKAIGDKIVNKVGQEAFNDCYMSLIGATLDYQIQLYYEMHKIINPATLPIAMDNLQRAAAGR